MPILAFLIALPVFGVGPGLVQSKHNLAVTGNSQVQAVGESDMCVFCHTPHMSAGQKALWNHALSTASYIPYSSTTLKATVGQPTGDSKLCLSCHDGTVALGMVRSRKLSIPMRGSGTLPPGHAVLGTDLSDDHPVSFTYDSALAARDNQLKDPSTLTHYVRLADGNQVQCTSCHDPHSDQNGKFLVENNYASALCLTCHNPEFWARSVHRNSGATWNGAGKNPWPEGGYATVAANGCENCHAPHAAGTHQRLLRFAKAEDNCLVCHNGGMGGKDLAREFNKASVHPVLTTSSLHDAAENPLNLTTRHASCVDCHNPHAANDAKAIRPNAGGALVGVEGVDASGSIVKNITREYELCFRCHGDTLVKGPASVPRNIVQPNMRLRFSPGNLSFHPVEMPGKNGNVPSLLAPWNAASVIYCSDCHNNDQGPNAGGAGANGPHGSMYSPLLERNLAQLDFQPENAAAYALCYKCHSRDSILRDDSFKAVNAEGQPSGHRFHVVDQKTSCVTCHDSHGVQSARNLINFNTRYVSASSNGRLQFVSTGASGGNCTLKCHGADHQNAAYSRAFAAQPTLRRAQPRR
ncbi:MAG TPA: cytochrome c3 family protein [Verrucomicrobiae bacterium]|nr:cytochrome c3 family protein [Verrucomicrobiae bacterium]